MRGGRIRISELAKQVDLGESEVENRLETISEKLGKNLSELVTIWWIISQVPEDSLARQQEALIKVTKYVVVATVASPIIAMLLQGAFTQEVAPRELPIQEIVQPRASDQRPAGSSATETVESSHTAASK